MAVNFSVPHTRTSEYLILPEDIVVKPELNGRSELPDVEWLIESMSNSEIGQLQPIAVSCEDGKAILRAGHSRWRAALEINKRKLTPVPFKLRCVYVRANDQQGFLANIHENIVRNPTQPIDDAHNCAKLEKWNMTHEEIAKLYRQDVKWVEQRLALIDLIPEAQQAVTDGRMKLSAATHFSKLTKEVQAKKLKAKGAEAKITTADAKPDAPAKARKPKVENRAAVVRGILENAVNEGKYPEGVTARTSTENFCSYLLDILNGETESATAA